jgi:hypothetical protein
MRDYLWDKTGEPDPEIQHLEAVLAPLGHRPGVWRRRKRSWVPPLAIAASLLLATTAVWYAYRPAGPSWQVSALAGRPSLARLGKGQSLITDGASRAKLELSDIGEIEVEPNTQVSVVSLRPEEQRLALQRGVIHATIWAPPARFYVNTPSAVAVDLGCAYTLEVDGSGTSLVRVSAGWVAFEGQGRESFIPQSAACRTRPGKGPGIPFYEDASPVLKNAIESFDLTASPESAQAIVAAARSHDALTLWHLLRRVPASERGRVFDRLAAVISVPPTVTRDKVMTADPKTIDALWDALDLGDTAWWRHWKSYLPK